MLGKPTISVRSFVLAAGLLSALLAGAFGRLPEGAAARSDLQAAYARLARAIRTRNLQAFSVNHDPAFSVALPDGTSQSREQVEAHMRQAMTQAGGTPSIRFTIEKLNRAGDEVTATVRQQHRGAVRTTGGKVVRVRGWILSRDTWVKRADGWKLKQMVVLDARTRVDGKRYNPYSAQGLRLNPIHRQPRPL